MNSCIRSWWEQFVSWWLSREESEVTEGHISSINKKIHAILKPFKCYIKVYKQHKQPVDACSNPSAVLSTAKALAGLLCSVWGFSL